MSNGDPLAVIDWPAPQLVGIADARDKLVNDALKRLRLHPATPPSLRAKPHGWWERRAIVLSELRNAAEYLIPLAEALVTATGPERKAIVKRDLMLFVDALEARVNIPGRVDGLAWWLIRRAVDGIIETVFRQLEARGIVNVGRV